MADVLIRTPPVKALYPALEPFETSTLSVSSLHTIYYEQSGKRDGQPILYLHGGPGGGTSPQDRRYFDPQHYRIILLDQRGAGKSTPSAELKENTTWDLVEDIEKLRKHLKIETWLVFGGSWGSTLSLTYAQTHPSRVKALILRGIFTLRDSEIQWFYQEGASAIFPDYWEKYLAVIPEAERGDLVSAYYKRLTQTGDAATEAEKLKAAKAWSTWETATSRLIPDAETIKKAESDQWALAFARIECHYFKHKGWFDEGQLLKKENIDKIRHIPTTIVQGRYDVVCPATTAWALHRVFPEATFHFVPDAGHSAKEKGITAELIHACDEYKSL